MLNSKHLTAAIESSNYTLKAKGYDALGGLKTRKAVYFHPNSIPPFSQLPTTILHFQAVSADRFEQFDQR
jgi:hypothetical protein